MKKLIVSAIAILFSLSVFAQGRGIDIPNKPSGGAIGTAAQTVDKGNLLNVDQTTAGQTLTVPSPTNIAKGKTLYEIRNVGTVPFTLVPGGTVDTAQFALISWIGDRWIFNGTGTGSGGGGPPLTQTVTNGDVVNATSGNAVYDFVQDVKDDIDASIDLKVDKSGSKVLSDENYSAAEKSKLAGIAFSATANSSDATLLNRANHTGLDSINDIAGLQAALDLKAPLISPVFTTPNIGNATGNISGNAATVTTNANLIGDVTSLGNATTLSNTAVTPGSYTLSSITVDSKGRITSASSGSAGGTDSAVFATKVFVNTGLATKQAAFTSQAKNLISASPIIGSNAVPTFRAFSNFDLPLKNKYKAFLTNEVQAFGDSYTAGGSQVPVNESYINKIAVANNCIITNNAIGGAGVVQTCLAHFTATPSFGTVQSSIWMAGFNDLRRSGATPATLLKIKGCLRSTIVDQFLKVGAAASAVTNTGSWSNITGLGDKSAASLSGNARQSTTVGNTLTYTSIVSSNIVIGTFNTDGVTYDYGRFTVSIDGTVVQTFDPNGRADNIPDGSLGNGRTQEVLVFDNLKNSTHSVVITLLDAKTTVIDYFGVMAPGADCQSIFCSSVPHQTAAGYASAPAAPAANDAAYDLADLAIESVVNEFPNRPAVYVPLNNYFVPATDVAADDNHTNALGDTHLAQAFQACIKEQYPKIAFFRSTTNSDLEANSIIATGINIFRIACNSNYSGTATNASLAKAQMSVTTANADSKFEFFTSSVNNAQTLAFAISKDGNLTATKTTTNFLQLGAPATNSVFFGANGDVGTMSINRNSATGVFVNTSKATASISLRSANNSGTIEFLTSPTNNTTPAIAVNISKDKQTFFGGSTTATAWIQAAAGTTTIPPFLLTSGTNTTTAVNGALEYNGTNLFFTRAGAVRENVMTVSSVNAVTPTSPNRTLTVVIDGVTWYIPAKTTND